MNIIIKKYNMKIKNINIIKKKSKKIHKKKTNEVVTIPIIISY